MGYTIDRQSQASAIAAAQNSATVLLLRESAQGLEVLMLQRQASMAFAGGEWVFPGGATDAADSSARMLARVAAPVAHTIDALRESLGGALPAAAAQGIAVAACRETFEECGVLLARHTDGRAYAPSLVHSLREGESEPLRPGTIGGAEHFCAWLESHDLMLAVDELSLWSNWITPSMAPRRFDTRFFIEQMPAGQREHIHAGESQAARWVALDNSAMPPAVVPPITAPPTLFSLRELATAYRECGSLPALFAHARQVCKAPVMLKIVRGADASHGLLPWDDDYPDAPGLGVPCDDNMRRRFAGFPSRIPIGNVGKPAR